MDCLEKRIPCRVERKTQVRGFSGFPVLGYIIKVAGSGYCGNEADVKAYKETKKTMKGSIQACMISNVRIDRFRNDSCVTL